MPPKSKKKGNSNHQSTEDSKTQKTPKKGEEKKKSGKAHDSQFDFGDKLGDPTLNKRNGPASSRKGSRVSASGRDRKGSYVDFLDEQTHATTTIQMKK